MQSMGRSEGLFRLRTVARDQFPHAASIYEGIGGDHRSRPVLPLNHRIVRILIRRDRGSAVRANLEFGDVFVVRLVVFWIVVNGASEDPRARSGSFRRDAWHRRLCRAG